MPIANLSLDLLGGQAFYSALNVLVLLLLLLYNRRLLLVEEKRNQIDLWIEEAHVTLPSDPEGEFIIAFDLLNRGLHDGAFKAATVMVLDHNSVLDSYSMNLHELVRNLARASSETRIRGLTHLRSGDYAFFKAFPPYLWDKDIVERVWEDEQVKVVLEITPVWGAPIKRECEVWQ